MPPPNPALPLRVASIAAVCAEAPLRAKRLIAPSRRIGIQWLDAVARSGRPVLNVRVDTLASFAHELAQPEMDRRGLRTIGGPELDVLVGRVFAGLRSSKGGYLTRLDPGPGLTGTLRRSLADLRLAGIGPKDLVERAFEVPAKAREMALLLEAYEKALEAGAWIDRAGVFRLAIERLNAEFEGERGRREEGGSAADSALPLSPSPLPPFEPTGSTHGGPLVLLSADQELAGLEAALWDAIPPERRRLLAADEPGGPPEAATTDASLLRWISDPSHAPAPRGDGTAAVFRAAGEANEVREVFRRVLAAGVPFDDVEIVCADPEAYVPLVFETACGFAREDESVLPVTFSDGVPARFSRPGRALSGWLAWIGEGFPAAHLVRLLQDGLLDVGRGADAPAFGTLGSMARALPLRLGRKETLRFLEEKIASVDARGRPPGDDEARGAEGVRRTKALAGWKALRELASDLFDHAPAPSAGPAALLREAAWFLQRRARCASELDGYGRKRLLDEVTGLLDALGSAGAAEGLDVPRWLEDLPSATALRGLGPRPGCVHVSSLASGGHSGRGHTFLVGLDDRRFPGAGLQDPLLLDSERERLAPGLPTASARLARRIRAFERLLAGLRGRVTMSGSVRELVEDRELFPSPAIQAAYRILSGEREGDLAGLARWAGPPASFVPLDAGTCLDMNEWWVRRFCAEADARDPERAIAASFPHLGRGFEARDARASGAFTEFDGYVPEAGRDLDPTRKDGKILSATSLEVFGKCPMDYFFGHVLEIQRPEEEEADPEEWLDAKEKGSLLHAVFKDFMLRLSGRKREEERLPRLDRDRGLLREVLEARIREWKAAFPPPVPAAFERQVRELGQVADIFLREEEKAAGDARPFCFEASIGMEAESPGSPLDSGEPVRIPLGDGRTVRARGRIDRVDEVAGGKGRNFAVWDYKTGSAWGYDPADPFRGGRRLQNWLYLALAREALRKAVSPSAEVVRFGYFFPGLKTRGRRIAWDRDQLREGGAMLGRLCDLLAAGAFPCSENPGDLDYSDYNELRGGAAEAAEQAKRKAGNPKNRALEAFRALRGMV
ncbi:MAG: PD-(D/E)XK nuclease family protein [Planctomycetes bacterium]|nr:PD-(D/E)XK nuclease family protein [Planctomycetota bacterium]